MKKVFATETFLKQLDGLPPEVVQQAMDMIRKLAEGGMVDARPLTAKEAALMEREKDEVLYPLDTDLQ